MYFLKNYGKLRFSIYTPAFISALFMMTQCGPVIERHGTDVIQKIQNTKAQILQAKLSQGDDCSDCEFWAIWDFDGTILKGDCTEGLLEDNTKIYTGLAERSILAGFSANYTASDQGVSDFFSQYREKEVIDHLDAYTYITTIYAGTEARSVRSLARTSFNRDYKNYIFRTSLQMLRGLQMASIRNIVISASASYFVEEANDIIPVADGDIHGIQVEIREGKLTNKVLQPVTYAEGKTLKLKELLGNSGKRVYVLAGFGNSYSTDGDFLQTIANQNLPTGKPVTLMINGGPAPAKYENSFTEVTQKLVLKD